MTETIRPGLERRLKAELTGDVLFDRFSRGRYATDASHYQIIPIGVVAPRSIEDVNRAIEIAREEGIPITPRGGGTSQCGQTINTSLIVDCSKYFDQVLELDVASRRCVVEPGIVLDELNRRLKPLARDLMAIGAREADEVRARFPQVQRRVGGYNLDAVLPGRNDVNLAHILVGSEGTLGFSTAIELKLSPLLGRRAVGACHFGSFQSAMEAAQHIVKLNPIAVELIDCTMLGLARDIAMFEPTRTCARFTSLRPGRTASRL